jgi:hypothetical protein
MEVTLERTKERSWKFDAAVLAFVFAVGAALRFYALGRLSFWSDEVVTMMLARRESLADLIDKIQHWDATRALLHPYVLHQWMTVFGTSEFAARAFSASCGLVTITLIYMLARQTSSNRYLPLWAAWLAAISPLDVFHSREARMYSWLVMLTCGAWSLLLSFRTSFPWWKGVVFGLLLIALLYSHPLGTLMMSALGLGYLVTIRESKLVFWKWVIIQVGVVLAFLPWAPKYLDHDPEVFVMKLNAWYLLEWPEAFTGGRAEMVAVCVGLIAFGLWKTWKNEGKSASVLLAWFWVPTLLLLTYSLLKHPIFGARRYLLFVSPAYLLLLARGVASLPKCGRIVFGLVGAYVALAAMPGRVFQIDRSHYREAVALIQRVDPEAVIVVPTHGTRVCLGYYKDGWESMKLESEVDEKSAPARIWHVSTTVSKKIDPIAAQVTERYESEATEKVPGLRLISMRRRDLGVAAKASNVVK